MYNEFIVSQDSAIHTSEVNGNHLGIDNSHLWSGFRTEDERGQKTRRPEGEREMYDSEEIMKLYMKHWQHTQERINSLSLQGLSHSFHVFEMSLNPFFSTSEVFQKERTLFLTPV